MNFWSLEDGGHFSLKNFMELVKNMRTFSKRYDVLFSLTQNLKNALKT